MKGFGGATFRRLRTRGGLVIIATVAAACLVTPSIAQVPAVATHAWLLKPTVRGITASGDGFGAAVATSRTDDLLVLSPNDRTIASTAQGAAIHYVLGPLGWERRQRIVPPLSGSGVVNGIAISSSDIVLSGGSGATSVWVYRRTSAGGPFALDQEIQAESGLGTSFGASIAVVDDSLAILEPLADASQGCVYIYRRTPLQWVRTRSICGLADGVTGAIPATVMLSDDTLGISVFTPAGVVVRAIREPFEAGSLEPVAGPLNARFAVAGRFMAALTDASLSVFDRMAGQWVPVGSLSLPSAGSVSGLAAAPNGASLLVRAAERFWIAREVGGVWQFDASAAIQAANYFGADGLALAADRVVSGNRGGSTIDVINTGDVRSWQVGEDGAGSQLEPVGSNEYSRYGNSVSSSGLRFAVTSQSRPVTEVYSLVDGRPVLEELLPESGSASSLAGDWLMLGNGQEAKIFRRISGQWSLQKRVTGATYGRTEFGSAVAVSEDVAIVVAKNRVGSVCADWLYGLRRSGVVWSPFPSPTATYSNCNDRAISQINGSEIAVGANGAAHIYDLRNDNWLFRQVPVSGRVQAISLVEGVLGTVSDSGGVRHVAIHDVRNGVASAILMDPFPTSLGETFVPTQIDVSAKWAVVSGMRLSQSGPVGVHAFSFRILGNVARLESRIDVAESVPAGAQYWIGDPFTQEKRSVVV